MNGWSWLLLTVAVLGAAAFLLLIRGGEKRARRDRKWIGTGEVIDVRAERERARRRRGGAA